MKKNLIFNLRNQSSVYNKYLLVIGLVCSLTIFAKGQEKITRTFEKEIPVSADAVIRTVGPSLDRVIGHGRINTMSSNDGEFVVSKNSEAPPIYIMSRKMEIKTWEKAAVKQVVEVTIACKEESQYQDLFDALAIDLKEDVSGKVNVRYEMNIAKLQIENGWFREDDNSIILDNGKEYKLTFLKLSSTLFVPKDNELIIQGASSNISVQDHEGRVEVKMESGSFSANHLKRLDAQLDASNMTVNQVDRAQIKSQHSKVQIGSANELEVTSELSTYSVSKAEKLVANDLVNEKWKLGTIGSFEVQSGIFSEFELATINTELDMMLKNCDVNIQSVGDNIHHLIIENQNADIKLGVNNLNNYTLICKYFAQAKYNLPNDLLAHTSNEFEKVFVHGEKTSTPVIELRCKFCDVTVKP